MNTIPVVPPFSPMSDPLATRLRAEIANGPPEPDANWSAVEAARTRTLDALAGFEKMAEHAEPEFAPIVAAFVELHTRHGNDLTRLLADAGQAPDEGGSIMGSVNRMVVATRALFDEIDADLLSRIHSGEAHVVTAYEAALTATLPAGAHDCIAGLLAELKELLADTRPVE